MRPFRGRNRLSLSLQNQVWVLALALLHGIVSAVQALPIDQYIEHIQACSRQGQSLILTAAPGSGKSTRVAPSLRAVHDGQILVLQPRRAAARALALRIADERAWSLGDEIGYQVRFERRGNSETQVWLMTEGVLTRRLIKDPYLEGVSCVILDEFHERHMDTDIVLAWIKSLQESIRPDLQLIIMSATLDVEPLKHYLPKAQCIDVIGQQFDLQIDYRKPNNEKRWLEHCASEIMKASGREHGGAVLCFLPGVGEIKRCEQILEQENCPLPIQCLYGALSAADQDAVLQTNERRVILATNIAETSLTVPGVRTVIDSGRERVALYNAETGLDELRLQDCSQFSAIQRAGRAAREDSGRCIRLWSKAMQQRRAQQLQPEIKRIDLCPVALRLKTIHGHDIRTLPWYEEPESERLAQAEELLAELQLSEAAFAPLTKAGVYAASLPVHPRMARMLMYATGIGCVGLAASIAAICSERDVRRQGKAHAYKANPGPSDIYDRLCIVHSSMHSDGIDGRAVREVRKVRQDILRAWGDSDSDIQLDHPQIHDQIAQLLLSAFPDRVGKRSNPNSNNGKLCGGIGVRFDEASALQAERHNGRNLLFVAAQVQGLRRRHGGAHYARLAAEIDEADIEAVLGDVMRPHFQLRYREDQDKVQAQVVYRYLDLDLRFQDNAQASAEQIAQCLADALAPQAQHILLQDEAFKQFVQRVEFLREHSDLDMPEINFETLLRELCADCRSKKEILQKQPLQWLLGTWDYALQQQIDEQAPTHLKLGNGQHRALQYDGTDVPILAAKIQHCFGMHETPRIAGGKVAVKMHLLAPNGRPAQITDDLASFWKNTYAQVRKDLRGRYPKHDWPEEPF